jgi:hypothetical protein
MLSVFGFCGQILFEDSFDGTIIDTTKWTVSAFAGCTATLEDESLQLFYIGNNNANPGVYLTSSVIDLPANWSKIRVRGQWWWESGTTGEFYIKLYEAGNESGNYFRPTYAAYQGPKFCAYRSGSSAGCTAKPWPTPGTPVEMTVTKTGWTVVQNGEVFANESTTQMADVEQFCVKLGGWDYSALTNTAFFDAIEISVELEPSCPSAGVYSQMPQTADFFSALFNDGTYSQTIEWLDNFPDTRDTLYGVRWWGLRIAPDSGYYSACQPDPVCQEFFFVTFYADKNGLPDLDTAWDFWVYPTVTDTGLEYQAAPFQLGHLYEYTADFPPVPSSLARWISIKRFEGEYCDSDCMFAWMGSNEGDGSITKVTAGLNPTVEVYSGDLAFCLLTGQERFSGIRPCSGSRHNPLQPLFQWQFDQPAGTVYDLYIDDYGTEPMYGYAGAEDLTEPNWLMIYPFLERSHIYWRVLAKTGQGNVWSPLYHFYNRSNPGDLTYDTIVKFDDLEQVAACWLDGACDSCSDWCGGADLNYNGNVTLQDVAILASHWFDNYSVNDECQTAEPLTVGVTVNVHTLSATGTDITTCGTNDSKDLWYSFSASADGNYRFEVNSLYTSDKATVAVFAECGGAQQACAVSSKTMVSLPASVTLTMTAGQTYYVRAAVENNATAQCTVRVSAP